MENKQKSISIICSLDTNDNDKNKEPLNEHKKIRADTNKSKAKTTRDKQQL